MPVAVLVELPPADEPHLTEADLAQQVRSAFFALRRAGLTRELCCSVSAAGLQGCIHRRYPLAYERLVGGVCRRNWRRFLMQAVRLRCFHYTLQDCNASVYLQTHIASNDLRCYPLEEDARAVRQADKDLGELLQKHLLQPASFDYLCRALAVTTAVTYNGAARFRQILIAPFAAAIVTQLHPPPRKTASARRLRQRRAVTEIVALLVEKKGLARHVGMMGLRRLVASTVERWEASPPRQPKRDAFPECG